jgi:hypothetical protein
MQTRDMGPGIASMEVKELKIINRTADKEVLERQKEINQSMRTLNKTIVLPEKTAQRYEELFGKQKQKTAIKITILFFTLALTLGFFLQPSIFLVTQGEEIKITNLSQREIKNINIYTSEQFFSLLLGNNTAPTLKLAKLNPRQEMFIPTQRTTVFFAFAERQLPAVGAVQKLLEEYNTQNINKQENDNNSGLYRTLKQNIP